MVVTTLPILVAMAVVIVDKFLICHVNLQNHRMNGSCDFVGRSLLW